MCIVHSNFKDNNENSDFEALMTSSAVPELSTSKSDIRGTKNSNRQTTMTTISKRNALMFNNEHLSDVKFIVGSSSESCQVIPAHKYVLAIGSDVFYAMFYGGLPESKPEIIIPDVEPPAFLVLLKYLYCDEIQLLDVDTAVAALYAAKKYLVSDHLARECMKYLNLKLKADNACFLLRRSHLFNEPELTQRCLAKIGIQTELVLQSNGFMDLDILSLESLLGHQQLNCKEVLLFEAALKWANAECVRQSIDATPQNKRFVLGNALYLIRMPIMKLNEFTDNVVPTGILTQDEIINVFLYISATRKPTLEVLKFPVKNRTGYIK